MKINEPCKIFSTTGSFFLSSLYLTIFVTYLHNFQTLELLLTYVLIGSCTKGPSCRYLHEATKVAVCKDYLMKGECLAGDSCDLSHDLTPERTPACLHFTRGHCSNTNCRYTHVHVAANAPVCRAFAIYGYCEKGSGCPERHVYECPDFSNTGSCNIKGCKLPHRHKASVIRRNTATVDDNATSDISSDDDDDEIDSDDVDSDDMTEELFGGGETGPDDSIIRQDNFIHYWAITTIY